MLLAERHLVEVCPSQPGVRLDVPGRVPERLVTHGIFSARGAFTTLRAHRFAATDSRADSGADRWNPKRVCYFAWWSVVSNANIAWRNEALSAEPIGREHRRSRLAGFPTPFNSIAHLVVCHGHRYAKTSRCTCRRTGRCTTLLRGKLNDDYRERCNRWQRTAASSRRVARGFLMKNPCTETTCEVGHKPCNRYAGTLHWRGSVNNGMAAQNSRRDASRGCHRVAKTANGSNRT